MGGGIVGWVGHMRKVFMYTLLWIDGRRASGLHIARTQRGQGDVKFMILFEFVHPVVGGRLLSCSLDQTRRMESEWWVGGI